MFFFITLKLYNYNINIKIYQHWVLFFFDKYKFIYLEGLNDLNNEIHWKSSLLKHP